MTTLEKQFPNGIASYLEVYYDVVEYITIEKEADNPKGEVADLFEKFGHGGLYEYAKELTDKFENQHKDRVWGEELDYYETIHEFIMKELYD